MNGGNLSDQQLKEFDAYLNNDSDKSGKDTNVKSVNPMPQPIKNDNAGNDDDLDEIIQLHEEKVELILSLLDKIDAKAHKDIVADLVDEMQYEKSVIKREKEQAGNLKKLIALAREATK